MPRKKVSIAEVEEIVEEKVVKPVKRGRGKLEKTVEGTVEKAKSERKKIEKKIKKVEENRNVELKKVIDEGNEIITTNEGITFRDEKTGEEVTLTRKFLDMITKATPDAQVMNLSKVAFGSRESANKRVFLIFMFYSFIGWLVENFVEIVINKWYYMPREFLRLPLCPIFGIGAVILLMFFDRYLLDPEKSRWGKAGVIFFGSVIITSGLEYLTSYYLEAATGTWPWKGYANQLFNLGGRIALANSLGFGLLAVISLLWIQPWLEYHLLKMKYKHTIDIIFFVLMAAFILDIYFAIKYPTGVDLSKPRATWAMIEPMISTYKALV